MGVKCQPHCRIYTLLPGNTKNAGEWSHVGWEPGGRGIKKGPEHKQNADGQNADDSLALEAKAVPSNKQPSCLAAPVWATAKPLVCVQVNLFCFQSAASLSSCDPADVGEPLKQPL